MNTLPTCSINCEMAVGTMRRLPCINPRKALITLTRNRLGAMTRNPSEDSAVAVARPRLWYDSIMKAVATAPKRLRISREVLNTRPALRGSSCARYCATMREIATGIPTVDMDKSKL